MIGEGKGSHDGAIFRGHQQLHPDLLLWGKTNTFLPKSCLRKLPSMPKKSSTNEPKGPTLAPDEARLRLEDALMKRGRDLSQLNPLPKERYDVWRHNSFETLQAACGKESGHLWDFVGHRQVSIGPVPEHYAECERRENLGRFASSDNRAEANRRLLGSTSPVRCPGV
jgi:hypothetical protein